MPSESPGKTGKVFPLPGKSPKIFPDVAHWSPPDSPISVDLIQHGTSYHSKVKNEHASCGGPNMMVPLLKHWTALPALSYFLTNSMHIRESSRRILIPSTFKPPPRMMMPESKRNLWLQDLAKPNVPLKRLARTVPSGLKGGQLLDQLYIHRVPLFRALWFIKCIGASELRSLKRKLSQVDPQSSETPETLWLREWTEEILGHFEKTILAFGSETSSGSCSGAAASASAAVSSNTSAGAAGASPAPLAPESASYSRSPGANMSPIGSSPAAPSPMPFSANSPAVNSPAPPSSSSPGLTEWGHKNVYILDIIAALFSEGLIDHSQLVDWVLNGIQHGHVKMLPTLIYLANKIWVALSQEIPAVKLARVICIRTSQLGHTGPNTLHIFDALLLRLFDALPDAFVMPDIWPDLEKQLKRATTVPALFTRVNRDPLELNAAIAKMANRNSVFISSALGGSASPCPWPAASKVGEVLSEFDLPLCIPNLVNDLRALDISQKDLFESVITWTIRKSQDHSVHLCLALFQHFASLGAFVDDYFVEFLMKLKPSQACKTLYNLVGWLFKGELFSIEKYLRRLISSGIMHFDGPQQEIHRQVLRNLPFSFMSRTLQSQIRMLLREEIIPPSQVINQWANAIEEAIYANAEPLPIELPSDLYRDQELRLSEAIYERYKARLLRDQSKVTPLHFSATLKCLNHLHDKYTVFKVVWFTLAKASTQALYTQAHSASIQHLFFFICMRATRALIKIEYDRRSYFSLSLPHTYETGNIIMLLKAASNDRVDSVLLDTYLKSTETLHMAPSSMTPESLDDNFMDGIAASERIAKALDSDDRVTLLRLRKHFEAFHSQFTKRCSDWLQAHPEAHIDLIIWCLANYCFDFSDVYNCLIDRRNDTLCDVIFEPMDTYDLTAMEQDFLSNARTRFTFLTSQEDLLHLISGVSDIRKMITGINVVLGKVRYNSDKCSQMIFEHGPNTPEKVECLRQCVEQQLGISFADGPNTIFCRLVDVCNAFNTGFCQIAVWLNFNEMSAAEVAEIVLGVIKSGGLGSEPASLGVLFELLPYETKQAIHSACQTEFFAGAVPNAAIEQFLIIIPALQIFAARSQNHSTELIQYVSRVAEACKYRTVTAAEIKSTLVLLLKLVVVECAPSETCNSMDAEYSKVILPTVSALCLGLQQSPVVEECAELSSMIGDALHILVRREENVNSTNFNLLQSSLGGLMMYSRSQDTYTNLVAWPFDLIEETTQGSNDVPLDLSRFETYVELMDTT